MKLSLEWIRQYVDIPEKSPDKIAHRLTMATAEVEGVELLERITHGVFIGEITAVETLNAKEGKELTYVTVNTGKGIYKSVCGAPNVKLGLKSAFALPGTELAGGLKVKAQKVYGQDSEGILCSPRELGWGESHAGIMAFPENSKIGTELSDLVPAVDYIIDIDNKAITHRPDLWGHYGFARELAAIYGAELKPLEIADSSAWENLPEFPLRIEDMESCPGYCCLDMGGLKAAYSPLMLQYRLLAIGLRPINLLVDLTNYIMCELGQPMHAFDGERVRDIVVKPFGKDGTFMTLDSIERQMKPDDLMICDHDGPIALAGIMGGENTEIKDDTSRLLLESANFNPARIRRTSLRLVLRTDASIRFEKGQPQYHMALSIKRLVQLLIDAGQKPEIHSRLTCAGDDGLKKRILEISADELNRSIGMDIPGEKIESILESLGFGCEKTNGKLKLVIPPYRSVRDISIPRDIVEEVARIYGYDNIAPSMPETGMTPYIFNDKLRRQHKIRRFLSAARNFAEVHTHSWYDENWLKRIGYNPPETLVLKNPTAENNTRMRLELIPNLLGLIESNFVHRDAFRIYELGNVHKPSEKGCDQSLHLAGIAYQNEKSGLTRDLFLSIKGAVEDIFTLSNAEIPNFKIIEKPEKPWQFENDSMEILLGGKTAGFMGWFTDKNLKVFEKGAVIVWFEINLDTINSPVYPEIEYDNIPVYPGSWMDFSVLVEKEKKFLDLDNTIKQFTHPVLRRCKFLYLYDGKGLPEEKISYTFRFWLGLKERTLAREDIVDFQNLFIAFLGKQGMSLR